MKRTLVLVVAFGVFIFLGSYLFVWQARLVVDRFVYDLLNPNPIVESKSSIDAYLDELELLPWKDLPADYLKMTKINDPVYAKMHAGATFYIIPRNRVFRYVVGQIRLEALMPKDRYFKQALFKNRDQLYWRIDRRILYKILELRELLEEKDYDENAFFIRNGYRTPAYNKARGGASKSRHIKGEAVDMIIKDINKDGQYTDQDKQIVIELLEQEIIKSKGGIGKYPGSRVVHMDVRGHKARWDSY